MHVAVHEHNDKVFEVLLSAEAKLELKTSDGFPPLWYALKQESRNLTKSGFAATLIGKGASTNTVREFVIIKTNLIVTKIQANTVISYYLMST